MTSSGDSQERERRVEQVLKRFADRRIARAVSRILPHITEQEWNDALLADAAGLFGRRQRVVGLVVYRPPGLWVLPYSAYLVLVSRTGRVYRTAYPWTYYDNIVRLNSYTGNDERNQIAAELEEYADSLVLNP